MSKFNNIVHSIITEDVEVGSFNVIDKALGGGSGSLTNLWKPGTSAEDWFKVGVTIDGGAVKNDLLANGFRPGGSVGEKWEFFDVCAHAIENPNLSSMEATFDKQPYIIDLNRFRDYLKNSLGFIF